MANKFEVLQYRANWILTLILFILASSIAMAQNDTVKGGDAGRSDAAIFRGDESRRCSESGESDGPGDIE